MNKKFIKDLAKASYTNEELDIQNIEKIAPKLTRLELKLYIKYIKELEQQKTIIITTPMTPTEEDLQKFQELYPNKKIVLIKDNKLLLGLTIQNNDIITEYNLKNTLDDLVEYSTL